jgi:Putative beta-lactamase-inhibitor-like, PepSY-like
MIQSTFYYKLQNQVMKTQVSPMKTLFILFAALFIISCNKNDLGSSGTSSDASNTIAVAASLTSSTAGSTDSVYLMQTCRRGESRDSIAQTALPPSVTNYISANYNGSSFAKAFALKNSASVVTGYVVVIYYNNNPVGLQFDSSGNFVKVLEQRERGDLNGPGWHHGGRFEHRDGLHRDSIALNALPTAITSYFSSNYSADTLEKAFYNRDSSIVVLSKNNGLFATVFKADGTFISREQLPSRTGSILAIDLTALPSVAANYLSQTYPNYVFEKAFAVSENGSVKGYVVIIDANNTKYAVEFDTSGNFIRSKTIH